MRWKHLNVSQSQHTSFLHTISSLFVLNGCSLLCRFNGESIGLWSFGTTIYIMVVVIVNVKLATHVFTWMWFQILLSIVTLSSLFIFVLLLATMFSAKEIVEDLDTLGYELLFKPSFWLLFLLCPIIACLPDVTYSMFCERANPMDVTILQELENGWEDGKFVKKSLELLTTTSSLKFEEQVQEGGDDFKDSEGKGNTEFPLVAGSVARRKTWREVVSDDAFEPTDLAHSVTWDGKKRSSGYHMVTRLSNPHQKPRPLQSGPTPSTRKFLSNIPQKNHE